MCGVQRAGLDGTYFDTTCQALPSTKFYLPSTTTFSYSLLFYCHFLLSLSNSNALLYYYHCADMTVDGGFRKGLVLLERKKRGATTCAGTAVAPVAWRCLGVRLACYLLSLPVTPPAFCPPPTGPSPLPWWILYLPSLPAFPSSLLLYLCLSTLSLSIWAWHNALYPSLTDMRRDTWL